MRLLVALVLLLAASSALAGPVVVALAASAASAGVVGVLGLTGVLGALVGTGVALGVSVVLGGLLMKPGKQQSQPTWQAEMRDRLHVIRTAVEPRRIVYGQVLVSGPLVYAETTGDNNEFLHMVIALAGHECEEIGEIYFNDELVPIDSNGLGLGRWTKGPPASQTEVVTVPFPLPGTVTLDDPAESVESIVFSDSGEVITMVPNYHYTVAGNVITFLPPMRQNAGLSGTVTYYPQSSPSYVRVKKHLGADDQTADSDLVSESAGQWTTDHRLRGIAYVYVRLEWSEDVFPTGIPNVKAVVKGKKLEDPRSSPSVAWSDNWALVLRDYLTASYGLGCGADEIDDTVLAASANICDELVDLDAGSPSAQHVRYNVNGTVNLADRPVDIIRALCTAAAGAAVFTQGVWKVLPGAYVQPTAEIDESWLRGPVRVQPRKPRREIYNGVRGTFASRKELWQPTDFPPINSATYVEQDNDEEIWRDIELPYTDDSIRAQRIAKIHLEKSRQSATIDLPCNLKAFGVAVWDTVKLSLEVLGYEEKVFQVLGWTFNPAGGVDLKLQEEASSAYDWNAGDATELDPAPDTNLPNPLENLDITLGTPVSGTDELFVAGDGTVVPRIRVPFSVGANPFVKYFEVQFARSAGSPQEWQDAPDVAAPATQAFIHPVKDGIAYDGRIRAVTSLGNAGPWAMFHNHTVVGKTAVPSDVTGFSAVQDGGVVVFSTNALEDADLDLIEVRRTDLGDETWENGEPTVNILRGYTQTNKSVPPGDWTFLAKAKDTSGNYSQNVARADVTVTSTGYTNIEVAEQGPAWNGALTNMVRHWTGVIFPDSTKLASEHTKAELFEQFVAYPQADCYYEAPVIDKGIDAPARIHGDIVSTLGPGVTTGIAAPELQVDYRESSDSFNGFEVWSVGVVEFRYVKARIYVDTSLGKPVISQFTPTIDAATREESGTLTVDAGGSGSVTFATAFHNTPALSLTPEGSGDVSASYTNLSTTGFTGHFKTAGVAGAGSISYSARGP